MQRIILVVSVVVGLLLSCAPAQNPPSVEQPDPPRQRESRTLIVAHRYEPSYLAPKVLGSNGPLTTTRLFNAALVQFDNIGTPRPYLAEALPQLNTESWRVFPDGRMETTYRLRPNLTWHDGAPLTAEDFAFALRVYKQTDLGIFTRIPQGNIDNVLSPDARTVVIQWKSPNPDAGTLSFGDLDPLPAHVLEAPFTDLAQGNASREGFLNHPFWTSEYLSLIHI